MACIDEIDVAECTHPEVTDNSCDICGVQVNEKEMCYDVQYTDQHQRSSQDTYLGFDNDLKTIDLPDEVKNFILKKAKAADKITHKMGTRRKILYAYSYMAYVMLGYEFQPDKLAKKIGLKTKGDVSEALRMVSGTSKIKLPQGEHDCQRLFLDVASPLTYLDDALETAGMQDHYVNVKFIAEAALSIRQILFEEEPKWFIIAAIKYYIDVQELAYPKFYNIYEVDCTSIKKCYSKIKETLDLDKDIWHHHLEPVPLLLPQE